MTAWLDANLGSVLTERSAFDEAERLYLGALPRLRARLGDDHSLVRRLRERMADLYVASGRPALADEQRALAAGPPAAR